MVRNVRYCVRVVIAVLPETEKNKTKTLRPFIYPDTYVYNNSVRGGVAGFRHIFEWDGSLAIWAIRDGNTNTIPSETGLWRRGWKPRWVWRNDAYRGGERKSVDARVGFNLDARKSPQGYYFPLLVYYDQHFISADYEELFAITFTLALR